MRPGTEEHNLAIRIGLAVRNRLAGWLTIHPSHHTASHQAGWLADQKIGGNPVRPGGQMEGAVVDRAKLPVRIRAINAPTPQLEVSTVALWSFMSQFRLDIRARYRSSGRGQSDSNLTRVTSLPL